MKYQVEGHEPRNTLAKAYKDYCNDRTSCRECRLDADLWGQGHTCKNCSNEELLERFGPDIIIIHEISDLANDKPQENDMVNHPAHYTAGGIECIDAIAAALTCQKDPMEAWLTGQILKYLWRWPMKNGLEDLKKAQFYLNRLIESLEKKKEDHK